jgi:RibD C-terminal domain
MRKLVANFFLSLDGVMEAPDKWQFPYFNDEIGQAVTAAFTSSDALLLGRVNYPEWAAYWPTSTDQPIADIMNNIRKHVVSTTLDGAVAFAVNACEQRDCRHENPSHSLCSTPALRLCRLPLPLRRDRRCCPLVPAVRPVLSRRRRATC